MGRHSPDQPVSTLDRDAYRDGEALEKKFAEILERWRRATSEPAPGRTQVTSKVVTLLHACVGEDTFVVARFSGQSEGMLTQRERQIVRLVGTGLNNERIGVRLKIRKATVAAYLRRIFLKLETTSRAEVAVYSIAFDDPAPAE